MARSLRTFISSERAVAAIEFALLLPVLLLLSLGAFELQRYMRFERQLTLAANNIASLTAQRQATNAAAPREDINSMPFIFPMVQNDWYLGVAYRMTHVVFTPTTPTCVTNCQYNANVAWYWPLWTSAKYNRQCGAIAPTPAGAEQTAQTLPNALFGPGALIVLELTAKYRPVFGGGVIGAVTLTREGFAHARFAEPYLKLNQFDNMVICPGY